LPQTSFGSRTGCPDNPTRLGERRNVRSAPARTGRPGFGQICAAAWPGLTTVQRSLSDFASLRVKLLRRSRVRECLLCAAEAPAMVRRPHLSRGSSTSAASEPSSAACSEKCCTKL
jgi:hypothetical protein